MEMQRMSVNNASVLSTANAPHYTWGRNCDGWHLVQTPDLSVIQEEMPPGTSEQLHYHEHAQQMFYILSGIADFEIDGRAVVLKAGESIHVNKLQKHRIINKNAEPLSFILVSQPRAHGDRINCP